MKKLTDLAPHWITFSGAAEGVKFYYGISFLCPHCEHSPCPTCGHQRGTRLAVSFWPPIDPDGWEAKGITLPAHDHFHKRVSGDTFADLTLFPSVGLDPHWHGHIADGQLNPS